MRCRPAPISSSSRAASPTATICAAARSRRARRSWMRCARMPSAAASCSAVCNGFQILCETGLLPGVLMRNAALKFICRDVYLRVERSDTPFTRGYNAGQVIRVPVAHGEGNYVADKKTIARLEGEGRVLFRYTAPGRQPRSELEPQRRDQCHRRYPQRRRQRARHDAASREPRRGLDGLHRRPRAVCRAGAASRRSRLSGVF